MLKEKHEKSCECSYCKEHKNFGVGSIGLVLPRDKSWNSWRKVFFIGKKYNYYLRWTWGNKNRPK